MFNKRFLLPAIIAVALHAIVLLGVRGHTVVIEPPAKPAKVLPPDQPPEVVKMEANDSDDVDRTPGGGGTPGPKLPDLPVLSHEKSIFTVPIVKSAVEAGDIKATVISWRLPAVGPGDGPGGPGGPMIPAEYLDRVPNARLQGGPTYPPQLRHAGIEGEVLVEFDVNERGTVTRAAVRHSTHRDFDEPTLRAVLKWRFEPGRRHGLVVPFRMAVPVRFRLNES